MLVNLMNNCWNGFLSGRLYRFVCIYLTEEDPCASLPSSVCGLNAYCVPDPVIPDTYTCNCLTGYEGNAEISCIGKYV